MDCHNLALAEKLGRCPCVTVCDTEGCPYLNNYLVSEYLPEVENEVKELREELTECYYDEEQYEELEREYNELESEKDNLNEEHTTLFKYTKKLYQLLQSNNIDINIDSDEFEEYNWYQALQLMINN